MTGGVKDWKQVGRIYLWRYTENERNYPGWHMTADNYGCASLAALLRSFQALQESAYRTITLTPPTAAVLRVPNNRGGLAGYRSAEKWRITFLPEQNDSNVWSFEHQSETVELTLGKTLLSALAASVDGIPSGKGDYSIGGSRSSEPLWFWWGPANVA